MSIWPKISIVTPSFNQGNFIEDTIQSVLSQNYPNLEYIVMDGGSSDATLRILKKYEKKLTWKSEKDRGQTDAINKGMRLASGEIRAYLNSDDVYEKGTLKKVAEFFLAYPSTHFLYGRGRLIDADGKHIGFYNDSQATTETLHGGCVISQPTTFWSEKTWKQVGEFDESYNYTMDYEYWVRVSKHFEMVYLPDVLASSRIHPDAKTSSQTQKLYRDAVRVQKKYYPFVHHDWIFTYSDGTVHALKHGTFFEKIQYWLVLFSLSVILQLSWNRRAPTKAMWKQYHLWMKEIKNEFL